MKKKRYNTRNVLNILWGCVVTISVLSLSLGYADIVSTDMNLGVFASAAAYAGMFISDVVYVSNTEADLVNSEIIDYTDTMLHSNIYLSPTNAGSTITYSVTIFNNSDATKEFSGVTYLDSAYSNTNIKYTLNGMPIGTVIPKGDSKTFEITFSYSGSDTSNNQLNSYLSFNFDYYLEGENEVDIVIDGTGSYTFPGVSPENTVDLKNIGNVTFSLKNTSDMPIIGVEVTFTYTTTTGNSKQTAKISLCDENGVELKSQYMQFEGKQTNTDALITFSGISFDTNSKFMIKSATQNITNGAVDISNVVLKPIY